MNVLFMPIDSRGAAIPYIDVGNQMSNYGLNSFVYVTQDLTKQVDEYEGISLIDDFNLKEFITGHNIYESATNTMGLFLAARNVMQAWIPNAMQVISSAEIDPTDTLVVSNTVGFMYLGHFLLAQGFKYFHVMEPYRMLDWKNRWDQDASQFFPKILPNTLLLRMLFAQHGKKMAQEFLQHDIWYDYHNIEQAIVDQVLMYSPQLSRDTIIASGYPYPIDSDNTLNEKISGFIGQKKTEDKLLVVFTLGSMDVKESEKREIIEQFVSAIQEIGASAVILGYPSIIEHPDFLFADYFVRYNLLFPQADLIVQHCGSGTTHLALWSGTPVFAIPFLRDQYDWADRLGDLGMLVGCVPKSQFTKETFISHFNNHFGETVIQSAKKAGERERSLYNNGTTLITERVLKTLEIIRT